MEQHSIKRAGGKSCSVHLGLFTLLLGVFARGALAAPDYGNCDVSGV
jgi:hypothetical protein